MEKKRQQGDGLTSRGRTDTTHRESVRLVVVVHVARTRIDVQVIGVVAVVRHGRPIVAVDVGGVAGVARQREKKSGRWLPGGKPSLKGVRVAAAGPAGATGRRLPRRRQDPPTGGTPAPPARRAAGQAFHAPHHSTGTDSGSHPSLSLYQRTLSPDGAPAAASSRGAACAPRAALRDRYLSHAASCFDTASQRSASTTYFFSGSCFRSCRMRR